MQFYLLTSGKTEAHGYRFLNRLPEGKWWQGYSPWVDFNEPALVMRSRGTDWSLFISDLPSSRRDPVGRQVSYGLAIDGAATDSGADRQALSGLLQLWLEDTIHPAPAGSASRLGGVLDETFPEAVIEELFDRSLAGQDVDETIQERLAALVDRLRLEVRPGVPAGVRSTIRVLERSGEGERWIADLLTLAEGRKGDAVSLRHATPQGMRQLRRFSPGVSLLVPSGGESDSGLGRQDLRTGWALVLLVLCPIALFLLFWPILMHQAPAE